MIILDKKYQQLVRDWQQELLKGNYRQGFQALRTQDDSYCCLGVFCKSFAEIDDEILGEYYNYHSIYKEYIENTLDNEKLSLFHEFIEQVSDIGHHIEPFDFPTCQMTIESVFINLNDTYEYSFEQISDWIDKNIKFQ